MSAGRFKSRDDYFTKRSDLTKQVIQAKSKKTRKRKIDTALPVSLFRRVFCRSAFMYEIVGEGRHKVSSPSFDSAVKRHIEGISTIRINPLSSDGETAWNVVSFDISESVDQPFSRAQDFAQAIEEREIPSLLEVTDEGKGHYHLWIFHEQTVPGQISAEALREFGRIQTGLDLLTVPSPDNDIYVPLPLQGETSLLQRGVFVNSVGKMIKNQREVLETIPFCRKQVMMQFITSLTAGKSKTAFIPPQAKVEKKPVSPESTIKPAPVSAGDTKKTQHEKTVLSETIRHTSEKQSQPALTAVIQIGIGDECYAIDPSYIRRIVIRKGQESPQIPGYPFAGYITFESGSIPVFSYGLLRGKPAGKFREQTKVVIVKSNDTCYGLVVDTVSGLKRVAEVIGKTGQGRPVTVICEGDDGELTVLDPGELFETLRSGNHVKSSVGEISFLVIHHGGVSYCIPASAVREVLAPSQVRFRNGSSWIEYSGGRIRHIPLDRIVNPGEVKPLENDYCGRIVVVNGGDNLSAVGVDRIEGLRKIPTRAITTFPGISDKPAYITGAAIQSGESTPVYILDAALINSSSIGN